jgi:hypothetical protein
VIVVSNTSPIINLAAIGQFDVLRQMYGSIQIPQAVYNEIVVRGQGQPGAAEVQAAAWMVVQPVASTAAVRQINPRLNPGEAEAISLAVAQQADLLLMDERQGRQAAAALGVSCTGLLGVLLAAKQRGFVVAIRPLLDALRTRAGFWISDAVYAHFIQVSGEEQTP